MIIEVRQLRHFLAVVELGNFSAAAEHVFVSQSALTRSIQHLEQSLGAILLARGSRRTVPTPAGQRLVEYARMILQDCSEAAAEVRVIQAGTTGEVAFGFDSLFAFQLLDAALARVTVEAPGLAVRVVEAPVPQLLQHVEEGRLEFALVRLGERGSPRKGLHFEPLLEFETALVAGRGHPIARQRSVTATDLVGTRWLVLQDPQSMELHQRFFEQHRIPPARAVQTNSLTLIRDQVMHGRFLSLLPEPVVRRELRHRLLRRIDVALPADSGRYRAGLVTRSDAQRSAAVGRVMRIVRDACGKSAAQ